MQETLKFIKIRDVKTPEYGTDGSAGIDFFIPFDFPGAILTFGQEALIPTGIKARVPDGYALITYEKSGVATKKGLSVGAKVVDSDYQGEIHMHVFNRSHTPTELIPGMKLVQFLLMPVAKADLIQCFTEEDVFPVKTERGTGGFGSTDKVDPEKVIVKDPVLIKESRSEPLNG